MFELCQSLVILKEEGEVLVRDIDLRVASQSPMLLLGVLTTTECILGDLHKSQMYTHLPTQWRLWFTFITLDNQGTLGSHTHLL